MAKGREKSDDRIVPEGSRKAVQTIERRGGKSVTASKQAGQLELFRETADSPKGDDGGVDMGRPMSEPCAAQKTRTMKRGVRPAMVMEEVASRENLESAFKSVAANKGAPGPDRRSVNDVREHINRILPEIQRQLLTGEYQPGMIRRVWIPKPGGGQRGLGIPDVVDRIVQQAVHQVLSPHYEEVFHQSSHGFRTGRSCHTAIKQARGYVEEGREWTVDIDLEKFFDRVNHDRLMSKLAESIGDTRLLKLIRRMLKARVIMPDGVVISTEKGTPQGGPLSPLLSNIVLNELGWELERRGHCFVRYCDDCNIYVRGERSGKRVMESISRFIERRLRLKVNTEKSAVARSEERHFVGFRIRRNPHDGNVEIWPSGRSVKRLGARIRELTPRNWGNSLCSCIQEVNEYLRGWMGFFRICTEKRELLAFDAHIRRRLRAIVLRHWKRKRIIAKRLIKLGVKYLTAWRNVYKSRRSWWALSHNPAVEQGLSNAWFVKQGLVSLASEWERYHQRTIIIGPEQLELQMG